MATYVVHPPPGVIYDYCYAFKDPDGTVFVGFEYDPEHGGIILVTIRAAVELRDALLSAFPIEYGQSSTENVIGTVEFSIGSRALAQQQQVS